jgi:hypothetical protein
MNGLLHGTEGPNMVAYEQIQAESEGKNSPESAFVCPNCRRVFETIEDIKRHLDMISV